MLCGPRLYMSIYMCVCSGTCLYCCMYMSRTHNTHIHAHTTHTPCFVKFFFVLLRMCTCTYPSSTYFCVCAHVCIRSCMNMSHTHAHPTTRIPTHKHKHTHTHIHTCTHLRPRRGFTHICLGLYVCTFRRCQSRLFCAVLARA